MANNDTKHPNATLPSQIDSKVITQPGLYVPQVLPSTAGVKATAPPSASIVGQLPVVNR